MSQRFYYGFGLTFLFISMNLLSMYNYELNKKFNYARNAKKKQNVLFKSPSSIPCFEQQLVVLQNNDASQYSFIFNRSQQPCITQYLLDGESVAKLIQLDDEINFTTDNCKRCTFSVQIPYQTGSLTINTQGRFIFEKKIDTYSAYITGKTIDFCDDFFSHNGLIVQADNCKSHTQLTCGDFSFEGKNFEIMPKSSLNMHNSLILTAQSSMTNEGIIDCKKELFITSSLCKNSGTVASYNTHFEGNMISNKGIIKSLGLLDIAAKNINLEKTSSIIADNVNFRVHETTYNEGTIEVEHHLSAHSRYIINGGKIEANSSEIKADRYFYNKIFSTLNVKNNLIIHTPFFLNLSGLTHAECLTINSAIGLNILGIYAAKNMDFNSLASINVGLFLPKFGSLGEICSWQNMWRLGESIFSSFLSLSFPAYGLKYTALKTIFALFQQGKSLCGTVNFLYKKGSIEASNAIVLACLVKNIFSSVKQTYNLNKSHSLVSNSSNIEKPQKDNLTSEIVAQSINIVQQLPATLMSLYAPNVNTDAIFDVNQGITIGINNNSSSLYNHNLSTSLYVNNTINTRNGKNVGNLGAYNLNIKTTNSYRSEGNMGVSNGKIDAYYLDICKPITALADITLQGNQVYINGNIAAKKINIQSDTYIGIFSDLTSSNIHLHSKNISQEGTITGKQVVMTGDVINNYGIVRAPKIIITQAHLPYISSWRSFGGRPSCFCNEGSLQASDQLFIDAADIKLDKKSKIDAPKANLQSDCNVQNDGKLKAEQCVIDAHTEIINNGSIHVNELFQAKAQKIHFRSDSDITTKKAFFNLNSDGRKYSLESDSWQNDGKLTAEQCVIDAQKQIINNGTINVSELFQAKAQNIHFTNTSDITTKTAVFEINPDGAKRSSWREKFNCQNDGHLKVEKCYMDVREQVINNGTINASELLNVKAQNISFQQGSDVKAKDVYYTADQNIRLDGIMDVEKGTMDAGGKVTAIGKIGASDQLKVKAKYIDFEASSNVCANKAELNATQTIHNQGAFTASNLLAHAKYVKNSGSINSNNAHIRADRCFWNQIGGSINVENNLNIDALVCLNILGYVSADYLCTNSIIDLNLLGIYAGSNICQNSLINYNAGILIPTWKSLDNLKNLFKKNKWKFAESFLLQFVPQFASQFIPQSVSPFVPQLAKIYSLSKTVVMCFSDEKNSLLGQGKSLIKNITDITDLYKTGDLCVSDVLPVLFQTKNMFTTVAQTGHLAYQTGQQVAEGINAFTKVEQPIVDVDKQASQILQKSLRGEFLTTKNSTEDQKETNKMTLQNFQKVMSCVGSQISAVALIAVPIFGPQLSRNSLLDTNSGLTFGVNGNYQSLYNANFGGSFFANNNFINTISGINTGIMSGGNVVVDALSSYISDGITAAANISLLANDLVVAGKTYAYNNVFLKAHNSAVLDREINAHQVTAHAQDLLIKENASIVSRDKTNIIATQTVINKGTLNGQQIVVQGNEVILDNGSKIYANAEDGYAVINAEKLHLKDDSFIDVNTATISAQSIQGEKGNTITSQNGTLIKTNQIDNHGTINGPVALEFNGKANNLESIGSLDHLMYTGTLENNIADKLANGHNTLLNIQKDGIVLINAQEQDVHLKEQHDISHTFHVQTNGSIQCDQDLLSERSLWLQAKGDVHHASVRSKETTALIGKNISSESHVIRENSGENYTETCQKNNVSGKNIIIHAQEDLQYKGTHVHSGIEGTQLFVGNKLIADAIELQEYSKTEEHEFGRIRKNTIKSVTTTENKITTSVPCAFTSDGATHGYVGNFAELHGTIFGSKGGNLIQGHFKDVPIYDTHIQIKETKQGGINKVITHNQSISIKHKPIEIGGETPSVLISDKPVSLHIKCNAPSITINAPEVEIHATKQTTYVTSCKDGRYVGLWDRKTNTESRDVIPDPSYSGIINTNAQRIYVERTAGSAPPVINATHENACIASPLIEQVHQHQKQSYNRPTPLAMSLIALSLSVALQGVGSSLGAGLVSKLQIESAVVAAMTGQAVSGTVNALCMETLMALANCNGDLKKAAQELASTQTIRNIALTAITAAAIGGSHKLLDKVIPSPSHATTFGQCVASAASREFIANGIRAGGDIAQGKDPKKAVKDRLKSAVAGTLGTACSRQIGEAYGDGKIGSGTHKALHTGLGALQGAILDGKNGAIAGSIGAGVAETIADIVCPKPPSLDDILKIESQQGRPLTRDEFTFAWNTQLTQYLKQTHSIADASKMIATAVAALAQQDINIAYDIATKAVDNNFLILVGYGITTACVAYSAYQINNAYQEDGPQAALQQLGIEVVTQVACISAAKIGFKVGHIIYPTAKTAMAAVLESAPGLKFALGKLADTLIVFGEKIASTGFSKKIASTGLGEKVKSFNKYANYLETKIVTAENKIIDKVKNKIVDNVNKHLNPSFAEDLVEHVVPNSVLNQVEKQLADKAVKESVNTLALPAPEKVSLLPASVINEVVKEEAGKIKSFPSFETVKDHIFSDNHKNGGILNLGTTKEAINDKFIEIIKKADIKNLLQEGPNNIVTKINGTEVTIRAFLRDDHVVSYDGFVGLSKRKVDNKIYL